MVPCVSGVSGCSNLVYANKGKGEEIMTAETATSFETRDRPWWLLLIQGIFLAVICAVMLWSPAKTKVDTYMLLVAMLGFYWVISGILNIVLMFMDHTAWGWKLFIGIISILAGGAILAYPVAAAVQLPKIFTLVLGIWALMDGILMLIMAFKGGGWGAGILGVLGIIFGIILMVNYTALGAGLAMIWTAAVFAVIGGIIMIVQAFRQRKA
jgi:uncharacterized membrane protein HdeD (DUF308 family)